MPDVLSTSPFTPYKLQEAIGKELEAAPANALTATAEYSHNGEWRSSVVVKVDKGRWVLCAGGFAEKDQDAVDYGAYGSVTVRF